MELERELPHSDEAEQYVLGILINNPDTLDEISSIIQESDFYRASNQNLFKLLKSLNKKQIAIDLVTVLNYAQEKGLDQYGNVTYITECSSNAISKYNVKEYAKIIAEKSKRRKLIKTGRDLIIQSYSEDIDEIVDKTEKDIFEVSNTGSTKKFSTIGQAIEKSFLAIEEHFKNGGGIIGVPTGYKSLDNTINGLVSGDLIIVAGRPSMGKTAFALNIGQHASKNAGVAMFSLEMPEEQITNRLLAASCLVNYSSIMTGNLTEDEFYKIAQRSNDLSQRKIFIDDESVSLNDIKARCKLLKTTENISVVIIDYLQLIRTNNKRDGREQEVAFISRELKLMAKELKITVIVLSQLSRAPELRSDHRPMMSDLRESGSIEQDADEVILLYRDDYYNKESEDRGIAEIILGKNRNGVTKTIKLAWLSEYQRFGELEIVGGK